MGLSIRTVDVPALTSTWKSPFPLSPTRIVSPATSLIASDLSHQMILRETLGQPGSECERQIGAARAAERDRFPH
jgi:hypothetical protein